MVVWGAGFDIGACDIEFCVGIFDCPVIERYNPIGKIAVCKVVIDETFSRNERPQPHEFSKFGECKIETDAASGLVGDE